MIERPRDPAVRWLLTSALLLGVATRMYNLDAPFGAGFDGWLGAMYGEAARNLLRSGVVALRGLPHFASGPLRYGELMPHLHHPPLLSMIIALSFRAFGVSDWSARLPPALAYLGALGVFFALVRRIATPRLAGAATLALAALPMAGIYGGLVNFESFVLLAVTATYLAYLRYRESERWLDLGLTLGLFALAIATDWFGAFIGPPIALHAVLARPRAPRWFIPLLGATGLAVVAALVAFLEYAWPGAIAELVRQARHRTSNVRSDYTTATYTASQWLSMQRLYLSYHFRPIGLALATAGTALAWCDRRRPDRPRTATHVALLSLVGVQAIVVFPQASFQHAFLSFPLSLAIALGVALAADAAWHLASLLRWPQVGRALVVLSLAVFGYSAQRTTWLTLAASHDDYAYRYLGVALARATTFEGAVATPGRDPGVWIPAAFYADRAVYLGIDSPDALETIRRAPPRPSAPVRYVVFTRPLLSEYSTFADSLATRYAGVQDNLIVVFDLQSPRSPGRPAPR